MPTKYRCSSASLLTIECTAGAILRDFARAQTKESREGLAREAHSVALLLRWCVRLDPGEDERKRELLTALDRLSRFGDGCWSENDRTEVLLGNIENVHLAVREMASALERVQATVGAVQSGVRRLTEFAQGQGFVVLRERSAA